MNKLIKSLITTTTILLSTSANAEPINLVGINIKMTIDQQKDVLTKSGFQCVEKKYPWGIPYQVCENSDKHIRPSNKKIRINCQAFNACAMDFKQLAQELVNQGKVDQMEYTPRFAKSFDGTEVLIEQFCGSGPDGDILCVEADKNIVGETLLTVTLAKGTLGQGEVTFD